MNKTRPIRIFWQYGINIKQITLVWKTIKRVLKLAGMDKKITIQILGIFDPVIYQDIDTKSKFFGQYDGGEIIKHFSAKQQVNDHNECYTVLLMKDEFFLNMPDGKKPVIGLAQREETAIVFVDYDFFFEYSSDIKCRIFCTVMHELGHIFNLPDLERKEEIVLSAISLTKHCANDCVMYPNSKGLRSDYMFCLTCLRELRDYFKIRIKNFGTISP